jgi:glycerophosphoryl diester phosphodiesterase
MTRSGGERTSRSAHSFLAAGQSLDDLEVRLRDFGGSMIEVDVLAHAGGLVVAHDDGQLSRAGLVRFDDALREVSRVLPPGVRVNVDVKQIGYESEVIEALRAHEMVSRTLLSSMELQTLATLRDIAPESQLGWSVPRARRDYLGNLFTAPLVQPVLQFHRLVLPRRVGQAIRSGRVDAVMANWRVVTARLVHSVHEAGGDIYAWTVDDPDRCRRLERLGVDGVITDNPQLLAPTQ